MLEIFQNTVLLYFYLIKIIHAHQLKNLKDRKAYNEKQKSPSAVPLPEGDSFNVFFCRDGKYLSSGYLYVSKLIAY